MIYDSKQWFDDIDAVVQTLPELDELAGRSVLITGAAGLVCSAIVDVIIYYNETHDTHIDILAAGRWPEEMTDRFGSYCEKDYFTYIRYDAAKADDQIDRPADYIIHGASNAFPAMIVKEPVETMLSNINGLLFLFDHARKNKTKRVLYISSSEVYGQKSTTEPFREEEYGYIDLLDPRNSYSVGKRAAETLCASYADEYGIETVIVRPGHIYGPTASPNDNRVASAFAYAAARGNNIVMKSDGKQIRSYCYCLDSASAILKVLLKGENACAYNISDPGSVISIKEMSQILAEAGNVQLISESASDEERKAFNPMSNSSLDSTALQRLGWKGCFNAEQGLWHTVNILRDSLKD